MGGVLGTLLGGVLSQVLDKVLGQLPVSENEKANAQLEASKALAENAGAISEAEARIAEATKEVWTTEVLNGNALTKAWRPVVAYVGAFILLWDGVLAGLLSQVLSKPLPGPSEIVLSTVCYLLLALVGVRSLEKIQLVRGRSPDLGGKK